MRPSVSLKIATRQPRVGDLGAAEREVRQIGEPFELYQPRVGNLGIAEPEFLQVLVSPLS